MAERAVGALLDYGVNARDVSVALKRTEPDKTGQDVVNMADKGLSTTTLEDAGAGAAKGAGIGLGLGALAAVASVAIPGVGLVVGGGALATALAGMAATTAAGGIAGGTFGYLKDQGIDEEKVARFENAVENGGAVVSVTAPSNGVTEGTVESVLEKYHAVDMEELSDGDGTDMGRAIPADDTTVIEYDRGLAADPTPTSYSDVDPITDIPATRYDDMGRPNTPADEPPMRQDDVRRDPTD